MIVSAACLKALAPMSSMTWRTGLKSPASVGMPSIFPYGRRLRPCGKRPFTTGRNTSGAVPKILWTVRGGYGTPTKPAGS
jgi:hypothetical protein